MSSLVDVCDGCNPFSDIGEGATGPAPRAVAGGEAPSLDNGDKSGRSPVAGVVKFMPGGMKVSVRKPGGSMPVGGKRGIVKGFSRQSRARLIELVMALALSAVAAPGKGARVGRAFWITLTYADMPGDRGAIKAQLRAFRHRLERSGLPAFGAVWKLELQARGVPHYHLIVVFESEVKWRDVADFVRVAWYELTGAKVVDVQTVYGDTGRLMRYLSKYMGKVWSSDEAWGRVWGVWNEDKLPWGDTASLEFSKVQLVAFLRLLRRWGRSSVFLRKRTLHTGGGLVFGEPGRLAVLLRGVPAPV